MSVTHIAGPCVHIDSRNGTRIVQRCSLCGEKLCDSKNVSMPVGPDGETNKGKFPTFCPDSLVRVIQRGSSTRYIVLPDQEQGQLPEDSCIDLVE